MAEFEAADVIISVSPSYWADVPGQFKAFIDRCTPWSNTHEPHKALIRDTQFPKDLQAAYDLGKRLVEKAKEL